MGLQSEKIAPGMEVQYVVKFTPEERVDYVHELICVTEREKFIVPIKAVGARGIFHSIVAFELKTQPPLTIRLHCRIS